MWGQVDRPRGWGWLAPPVSLWPLSLFSCLHESYRTFPSILAWFWPDLVWVLILIFSDSFALIPKILEFTKAMEIVMLVPVTLGLAMAPVSSTRFLVVTMYDSLVETPDIASGRSVSIISMSSSQWCALFHHLRYSYVVKFWLSTKQVRATQLMELFRNKPYDCTLIIIFILCCALIDGIMLMLMIINKCSFWIWRCMFTTFWNY